MRMMNKEENYHEYTYEFELMEEPLVEKSRYIFINSDDKNSLFDFALYGKINNLFITYINESNNEYIYLYVKNAYNANSIERDYTFRHMLICESITYHTKAEIDVIKTFFWIIK